MLRGSFDQPAVCLHSPLLLGRCTPNAHAKAPRPHNGFLAVKQATPRPHQWGGPACHSPGVTGFKPFKRLNILLACLIPQPTGTPRPHQWLLMGVQACRLPGLKPLKGLKLKTLKSVPFARRYTLQTLQTLKHSLGMPHPAANRHPKATSMTSYGSRLPFATLQTPKCSAPALHTVLWDFKTAPCQPSNASTLHSGPTHSVVGALSLLPAFKRVNRPQRPYTFCWSGFKSAVCQPQPPNVFSNR